jgi:outer membrane receptor protein involved in Fe transport
MRTSLFLLLSVCLPFWLTAQPGNRGPRIELSEGTGALVGRVEDEQTEEPILFANVLVYEAGTDQLVSGNTTNELGVFVIKDLAYGNYDLEISYLGYDDLRWEGLELGEEARINRVGRMRLVVAANELAEVQVTAERSAVEFGLDRRVFNVEKDIASTGGTAEDLLRNIPSVTVDLEGNISLRGSQNVRILINGKPSTLAGLDRQGFLQQLAAANIERIEVLTNPGAKYDPEGMGGIINIITKQQNRQGFNLQTSANVGTNDKYNGNLGLNYRIGKLNLQTSYSYNDEDRWFRGDRSRATETADTTWYQEQDTDGFWRRRSHRLQAGAELFLTQRATIELKGNRGWEDSEDGSFRDNQFFDAQRAPFFNSLREEIGAETEEDWEVNFNYRQRFREEGRLLTFSAQRSSETGFEQENFVETFSNPNGIVFDQDRQENPQPQENTFTMLQFDYEQPLGEHMKLEAGSRATIRDLVIDNELYDFNPATNDFDFVDALSNEFEYIENVYAAYGILSGENEQWEWQAGLRAEQTETAAILLEPDVERFPNNYFSLFPSAFLTRKLTENSSVQASYSRRINRPRFRALNPFIDYSDPLNPRGGNPYLRPEFINSYEVTYLKSTNAGSITFSGYYREINDMISRINQPDLSTGANLRTFANLNSGRNYGFEGIATWRPLKKMNIVVNGNAYRTVIDGNNFESDLNAAGYQFSGRLQTNYTFGKDWNTQLSGFYRSRGVRPQGEMRALYSLDFGLRKPILKGKGNLTLRVTDLFNTRRWSFINESQGITDDATFQRESRIGYIGFSYALRQDKSQRRGGGDRRRGDDGGGEDF